MLTSPDAHLARALRVLGLFAVPVAVFWRPGLPFFYILDDWTALLQMTGTSWWRYLTAPDGEQWFPFFHLVFYPLVSYAGENYALLLLINCLGLGLNACLFYAFLRRLFPVSLAYGVSLLYALAAAHHSLAWNAFYLCYLLSLTFFLLALLLTDGYGRRPSWGKLLGITLFSLLSILSHNYTLSGLAALPAYLLLLGTAEKGRRALTVSAALAVVYLLFAWGYLHFAGLPALTSHNRAILSRLPGLLYLWHIFGSALLSPFLYLFWGHYHFPVWTYVVGVTTLAACLLALGAWGDPWHKRVGLFALLLNLLPFVLISLARHQRSITQVFVARYGIFTLMGVGLLLAAVWHLAYLRQRQNPWLRAGTCLLLAAFLVGQWAALPLWQQKYLEMSRAAALCYERLAASPPESLPPEQFAKFCPTAHPRLTPEQVRAVRGFLRRGD